MLVWLLKIISKHSTLESVKWLSVCRPIEIPFGDKDQRGDYTLQVDDFVEFNIATDRRDGLQRATNITLVEDTFKVNGEIRERVSYIFWYTHFFSVDQFFTQSMNS